MENEVFTFGESEKTSPSPPLTEGESAQLVGVYRNGEKLGVLYVGPLTIEEVTTAVTVADGSDGDGPCLMESGYRHG